MEIEKALNRAAVSGQGDTGTSSRSFGTLLNWLSEHQTPVFVIGTTNDFTILPPEMIRKGRFDQLFWLDLPSEQDRIEIFKVLLTKYKRDPKKFNLRTLAKNSVDFTGAEIEQVIVSAMFRLFAEDGKQDITTEALLHDLKHTKPQAEINIADLERMRAQAKGKLSMASDNGQVVELTEETRKIDV